MTTDEDVDRRFWFVSMQLRRLAFLLMPLGLLGMLLGGAVPGPEWGSLAVFGVGVLAGLASVYVGILGHQV